VCVSPEQHNALQAFLDSDEALDTKGLEDAGVSNVASVITKLERRFGKGPIRRPEGEKGAGYYIRVRTRPEKKGDDTRTPN
jgi:hypothetical protein